MAPLPLYKASTLNIAQILKKCNDVSFIRAIQTCRWLYEIAHQMEQKSVIGTTAYLAIFVYYDKTEEKVMFDVPNCNMEIMRGLSTHFNNLEYVPVYQREPANPEEEDSKYWFDIISKETGGSLWARHIFDGRPSSELLFVRSDRERAIHKKTTTEQLGELLQFFRFKNVRININDNRYYEHPQRFLMAEEILKVFPFINAVRLTLPKADSEDLFDRTILAAQEHFNVKQLHLLGILGGESYLLPDHSYGRVDKLKFDWHSLEKLEGKCLDEDIVSTYKDLITRWETGRTNIKYLKLKVHNTFQDFQTGSIFLTTMGLFVFQYLHSVDGNRWAITSFSEFGSTFFFYEISDCDGCDCQTEFCFKKLIEAIHDLTYCNNVIDWGAVVDKWNNKENKTMEDLGTLMERLLIPHTRTLSPDRPPFSNYPPNPMYSSQGAYPEPPPPSFSRPPSTAPSNSSQYRSGGPAPSAPKSRLNDRDDFAVNMVAEELAQATVVEQRCFPQRNTPEEQFLNFIGNYVYAYRADSAKLKWSNIRQGLSAPLNDPDHIFFGKSWMDVVNRHFSHVSVVYNSKTNDYVFGWD